ncbi:hypothetical protein An08g08990 [Aspergillus niger]|uniref:Uncharacterized protein n=2 Tax=Aspergillus niger TaxID=5061 RepID=A5AB44_ASPNC|nr:hypothetical protein An08g08990 [Aspergillus niger]CAK96678.1 hypothetical protein An08g08990 [Aspergillus niger]
MQINDFQLTAPDLPSLSSTRQSSKDEHIRKTEGKGLASWQTGWVMQPDEQVLNGDPAVQDAERKRWNETRGEEGEDGVSFSMLCFGSEEEHGSLAALKGFSAIPQPVPGRPPFFYPMDIGHLMYGLYYATHCSTDANDKASICRNQATFNPWLKIT